MIRADFQSSTSPYGSTQFGGYRAPSLGVNPGSFGGKFGGNGVVSNTGYSMLNRITPPGTGYSLSNMPSSMRNSSSYSLSNMPSSMRNNASSSYKINTMEKAYKQPNIASTNPGRVSPDSIDRGGSSSNYKLSSTRSPDAVDRINPLKMPNIGAGPPKPGWDNSDALGRRLQPVGSNGFMKDRMYGGTFKPGYANGQGFWSDRSSYASAQKAAYKAFAKPARPTGTADSMAAKSMPKTTPKMARPTGTADSMAAKSLPKTAPASNKYKVTFAPSTSRTGSADTASRPANTPRKLSPSQR